MFNLHKKVLDLVYESDLIYHESINEDGDIDVIRYHRKTNDSWKKYIESSEKGKVIMQYDLVCDLQSELLDVSLQTTITGYVEFANDYEETDFISFEQIHPIIKRGFSYID